jgi:acetyl coenzyme A synthetase (ADP forming)-like protein
MARNRSAMKAAAQRRMTSLDAFFKPRSVAIVGASRHAGNIGRKLLDAVMAAGFRGAVYPVNPKAAEINGLRAHSSVKDLPEAVDLAVVVVPRDAVLGVVEDCGRRGVKAIVVITAGFAEVGAEGAALQRRLVEKIRESGMRMIGPNCFGLLNTDSAVRLNATFSTAFPPHGRVAMSSQSGAIGLAVLAAARRLHLGLSAFVSVGNKADISSNDLLEYWDADAGTDVILLYLESFGNPRRFARIARRVARHKPIVAVKAGRTLSGRRAAGSHTAALAASDVAVDALFHQAGIIRAETFEEMLALATALSGQPLPNGRRVAIVTNAGGPAILCADACEAGGLTVPELTAETKSRLAAFLPTTASLANPVDLIASATPAHYRRAIETLLPAEEVDAMIVLYIAVAVSDTAAIADGILTGILKARRDGAAAKPVLVCWMAEEDRDRAMVLQSAGIPSYALPEMPSKVLAKTVTYADWRARPLGVIPEFTDMDFSAVRTLCHTVLQERGRSWLSVEETLEVLSKTGLPAASGGLAKNADDAVALARRLGFPVAVKLASRQLIHKTDMGCVRLNLSNEADVRLAFETIRERLRQDKRLHAMDGVLVQPMQQGGVEVLVGMTQDPLFGPLVAFGLGGIHVEILGDVRFRITPLTDCDAAEMIREIKGYRLLEGYRGHPPADIKAIEEVLLRLSHLVEEVDEITEIDLNPVFALPPGQGCRIVDARIWVGPIEARPTV